MTIWDLWQAHHGHTTIELDAFPAAQERHFAIRSLVSADASCVS
jgi:hypothetical protein